MGAILRHTEIHYWGHAGYSILHDGHHLLIDPVLKDPFEYGDSFFNPPRKVDVNKIPKIDVIYISHDHRDHFDENTLKHFLKKTGRELKIFCPDDPELLDPLHSMGFYNIKALEPWETVFFGPYTFFTTPSPLSPFNELGLVVIAKDMIIWNQVDTSVDLKTIWKVKNKLDKKVDILFCPFQPSKLHSASWSKEVAFPKTRMENLLTKALAVDARYIVPSSFSLKVGGVYEWANTRLYPISKTQFVALLKKQTPPSTEAYEIEPGNKINIKNKKLLVEASEFITKTGKRIDFCENPHPKIPSLDLKILSKENWDEIVSHLKKLPFWLSAFMKINFVYYLECMKANNYHIIIEIVSKDKNLTFIWHDRLQEIKEVSSSKNWDYWFQYSGANLLERINDPKIFLPFYAFRNTSSTDRKNPESVLSLMGYNEEHTVDGSNCVGEHVHPLWFWPFSSDSRFWYND